MTKTAMQELIYELAIAKGGTSQVAFKDIYAKAIELATEYLVKEKEQIKQAYFDGVERSINNDAISPQDYYRKNFTTN